MSNLILSFRIWLWANLFICLLPTMMMPPLIAMAAKYSFACSFPVFYLLIALFSLLRFYCFPILHCWIVLVLTSGVGVVVAAQALDIVSDWFPFRAGLSLGLPGALLSLVLHHRAIHKQFQSFRYETEL